MPQQEVFKSTIRASLLRAEEEKKAYQLSDAGQAERLNLSLAAIEKKLGSSASKFDWRQDVQARPISQIWFCRLDQGWGFSVVLVDEHGQDDGSRVLSEMSLVQKAELAKLLPDFVSEYTAEQKRRSTLIADANKSLDAAMKLLEGA